MISKKMHYHVASFFLLFLLAILPFGLQSVKSMEKSRPTTIAQLRPPPPSGGCRKESMDSPRMEQCYQGVRWIAVPNSRTFVGGYDEGYQWIGANTITRRGDVINYDWTGQGVYIRYNANCRSRMLAIVAASDAMVDPSNFQPVNDYIGRSLAYACSISK